MTDTGPFPHDREPGSPMLAENRALRRLLRWAITLLDAAQFVRNDQPAQAEARGKIIVAYQRLTAPKRRGRK